MPQISPLVAGDPGQLGSFRLVGRVGEGGQGIVYLGVTDEGEQAAIKLLHVKFSGDTIARSRFARELKAAQRVASFCTARVIEADLDGDTPYIASEYIDGRALRDIVEADGPLRGTALDRLAIGTATALTAIHHASIVHRDFKPDNVLIAADGPRVVDFGIARIIDSSGTITSRAIGTPAYMAPEQIAGDDVGPYTDVFAWGAVIAFAATGETVFEGNSIAVVLNRILNHEVDVSMLPEPLRGVVRSALSKSPDERPSADQILLRLLGQPETVGASTAMLTRGVQVASDDTTPFIRVSSGTLGTGAPSKAQLMHPPEQSSVTGGEPIPWATGSTAPPHRILDERPTAASPDPGPPGPPAPRGRRAGWVALAVAILLLAAASIVAVQNNWLQLALGEERASPHPAPPGSFASVVDKVAQTKKIVIGVKGDLPGVSLEGDGGFEGFDIELAKLVAEQLGAKQTQFVRIPKSERPKALDDGTVDLVIATYSIDKSGVEFAGPYYVAHHDLLVRDGDPIESIDDLVGKKICAPDSPSVRNVQARVKVELVTVSNYAQCMDLLRSGEVAAVPGEDLILAGFASRENQRFKILGAKLNDERYAIGIKHGDAKTCKAANGIIAELYSKDVVKKLLAKYFANVDFTPEQETPSMVSCG
ncbi:serine/threonine-protein kinase [Nonomuraea sp. CA-143628]|uniref:serine/threonine-protein kinase n=1 Tax=Nonomuraea sp. CA-143628 TaxID=3239997 RepID=UPI003D933987